MRYFSLKASYIYGFFLCVALLGGALYIQHVAHLVPCVLCVIQRFIVLILAFLFLIGLMFHRKLWLKIHAYVLFCISFVGGLFAARQVWLQYFSSDPNVNCAPSLSFMLQHLPLGETIKRALESNGDCGQIDWTFMYLSIPVWTLIFFALVCGVTIFNLRRL